MTEGPRELQHITAIGFSGGVPEGLVLHPDGEHIIYPLGRSIVVKEMKTKQQTFLAGHDNDISSLRLSNSGRLIASGQKTLLGFVAVIILWDFAQRKQLHLLKLHKGAITWLSISPDEKLLVSLGDCDDNRLVIWDIDTGTAICGAPAGRGAAACASFLHLDNRTFVSGGEAHLRLWKIDLAEKKIRPTDFHFGKLRRSVTTLFISPDDCRVYCGTTSGDLLEFDLSTCLFKRSGPAKQLFPLGITSTAQLPDGNLIIGTGDGTLAEIQLKSTFQAGRKTRLEGSILSITVHRKSSRVYIGTRMSNIYELDTIGFTAVLCSSCHSSPISDISFPLGYSDVCATCSTGEIRLWNLKTFEGLLEIKVPNVECHCVTFTPDGKQIISGWLDGMIRSHTPKDGKQTFCIREAHQNGVTAVVCTPDGNNIVSGGNEGCLRTWITEKRAQQMVSSLKKHRARIWCLKLNRKGTQVVSASADGSVIVWNLESSSGLVSLFETTCFKGVEYLPDETQVLTVGSDHKIAYWDATSGEQIRVLDGAETGELTCISLCQKGNRFLVGGEDQVLRLWDYEQGICKHAGRGHSGPIQSCKIAPSQQVAISCGADGAIFVWNMP